MLHLGDITKINGSKIPVVDVITGGSPCQDLSVAGKRAGMAGERSGLFMEQIRLIKEMREYDRRTNCRTGIFIRPRFMVWENVPGAFSSNNGEDFRAVLEETAKIADPNAIIPRPAGRWSKAGCILGDGWSIAWRVHDAQFWGVPQRRKRIALVADFGGLSATEILFERNRVCGNYKKGERTQETIAGGVNESAGEPSGNTIVYGISSFDSNAMKSANLKSGIYEAETSRTLDLQGGNHACNQGGMIVLEGNGSRPSHKGGGFLESETMYTLNSTEQHAVFYDAYQHHGYRKNETCGTLTADQNNSIRGDTPLVTYKNVTGTLNHGAHPGSYNWQDAYNDMLIASANGFGGYSVGVGTLRASGGDHGGGSEMLAVNASCVRRLTPLECERLQGFPDNWTDIGEWADSKGKKHKLTDGPRYKALGNSIALPFWFWLLRRIAAQYERPATLGSLFDGIGGFPLCWAKCNGGAKYVLWSSEIEEFPIAVLKKHFGENEDGDVKDYL